MSPISERCSGRTKSRASGRVPAHLCLRLEDLQAVRAVHLLHRLQSACSLVAVQAALGLVGSVVAELADPAQAEVGIPHVLFQVLNLC
jgi:hypothetical protein